MFWLTVCAYRELVRFEFHIARGNFDALYNKVRSSPLTDAAKATDSIERVCGAVDVACIWYWKEVLCLQRSAAAVCLLKKSGIAAELVIGVQHVPFKAHAWVEVDGQVVNDRSDVTEMYAVLDRC